MEFVFIFYPYIFTNIPVFYRKKNLFLYFIPLFLYIRTFIL